MRADSTSAGRRRGRGGKRVAGSVSPCACPARGTQRGGVLRGHGCLAVRHRLGRGRRHRPPHWAAPRGDAPGAAQSRSRPAAPLRREAPARHPGDVEQSRPHRRRVSASVAAEMLRAGHPCRGGRDAAYRSSGGPWPAADLLLRSFRQLGGGVRRHQAIRVGVGAGLSRPTTPTSRRPCGNCANRWGSNLFARARQVPGASSPRCDRGGTWRCWSIKNERRHRCAVFRPRSDDGAGHRGASLALRLLGAADARRPTARGALPLHDFSGTRFRAVKRSSRRCSRGDDRGQPPARAVDPRAARAMVLASSSLAGIVCEISTSGGVRGD
jgi:hypothetical protein